ncbi:MAG: ferrous iron transporter B [Clostridia bacterium]|nr:ferrous iron transporter B [Clostridia bacterium]
MRCILVGNPNIGKTTLFNALTGARERVGNRAGVTVDTKMRRIRNMAAILVDLPGLYSLHPQSRDETVAAAEIENSGAELIINIVDATNLKRSLFLTSELMELKKPMIIALNLMDEAKRLNIRLDIKRLERSLGVPIIPVCAKSGEGVGTLLRVIAEGGRRPCALCSGCTAEERYSRIERLCPSQTVRPVGLDRVLCHRFWGVLIFFSVMAAIFYLTFDSLGAYLSDGAEALIETLAVPELREFLGEAGLKAFWISLLADGILMGVGGVLTFLPQVALLFLFLSLLEDSGYLSRVSFLSDSVLKGLGLNGKAFVPLLMGFGCTVPATMAARTLDCTCRKRTINLLPFLPCSAKLPVFGMMARLFFPTHRWLIVLSLYLIGIFLAVLVALIENRLLSRTKQAPFILELPPYRLPMLKNSYILISERVSHFLIRAGAIILPVSVLIWTLMHLTPSLTYTELASESLIGAAGRFIAPVFEPLGFGNVGAAVALLSGLAAKEAVISTLLLCFGSTEAIAQAFSPVGAYCFLVFVLLYPPCFAAGITARREAGSVRAIIRYYVLLPIFAYGFCNFLHFILQNAGL